mgnify:CR=1 FL=1
MRRRLLAALLLIPLLAVAACNRLEPAPLDPGLDFSDPEVGGGVGIDSGPQTPIPLASPTKEASPRLDATAAAHGGIAILVNNAGITGGNGKTWELSPEVWRRVVDVNLVGPFLTCRSVVPVMLKAGYGRVVNIASIAGKEGNPNASHYSASKAGLIGLTKSLAKELATSGILVNCITPAAAKTEIFDQMKQEHIDFMLSKIPMNRFLAVEEAAAMIAWLSSEDCAFSTGAVFDISGGRAVY